MATNLTETFSRSPFFRSLRQSHYTLPIRPEFLASSSFKLAGLSDENVLALFSRGFFGGSIFGFERFILRIGGYNILPARYTGIYLYFDYIFSNKVSALHSRRKEVREIQAKRRQASNVPQMP